MAIGFLLTMMVIFLMGSEKKFFESHYSIVCFFDNISGLREGATVQLAGINVGSVKKILFETDLERKKVKLVLSISERFQDRIRQDSIASIETQGLLGDKMVFISVGSPEKDILKDGAKITSRPPSDFSKLIEKGDTLLGNVNDVAKDIKDIVGEIRKGKGVIHSLVYDTKGAELLTDFQNLARNLNRVGSNLAQVTDKINRGRGTIGALVNDASLFNDMKTLLGKANRNKLIRAVIREVLKTKDERLLKKPTKQTLNKRKQS